jgi:hypothetical protein
VVCVWGERETKWALAGFCRLPLNKSWEGWEALCHSLSHSLVYVHVHKAVAEDRGGSRELRAGLAGSDFTNPLDACHVA